MTSGISHFKSRALDLIKTVKTGEPVLNLDRSVAAESLWPDALEKEADKAASILRSFFLDGFIVPYRTLGTCPQQVRRRHARGIGHSSRVIGYQKLSWTCHLPCPTCWFTLPVRKRKWCGHLTAKRRKMVGSFCHHR
jgi:hypothetical protein